VLACFPFAAHATAFKCTAANGQTSYQDTPCQVGAAEKSVELTNSSSALVTLMADAAMIGVHSWARKEKQIGHLPDPIANCLMSLKGKEFDAASQKALSSSMSSGDLQAANSFFAGNTGRKVGKAILAQLNLAAGETATDQAAALTIKEQIELQQFVQTSAGRLLIDRKFVANSDVAPGIGARAEELKKNCGAHR
jgi:hypothetical protein